MNHTYADQYPPSAGTHGYVEPNGPGADGHLGLLSTAITTVMGSIVAV